VAITETEQLEGLWSGVIDSISQDSPQNRAFLTLTKPLGLLKSEGGSNLLLAAPNGFAKDVLESRLKGALNDALSAKLGEHLMYHKMKLLKLKRLQGLELVAKKEPPNLKNQPN
jgi:chromosomal replication initiation ATPase DnaA